MIGVDLIGEIRRAYFEQRRPIKEIVRALSVSRATVRKVVRGQETEFKYARGVQPAPKLGEWVEVLTEILEEETKLPRRERRPRRGVPVRLEPRDDYASGPAADDQGGAHEAVVQPDAVRADLLPRDPGTGVRRPRQSVRLLRRRLPARHLRQHEDGGRGDLRR